MALNLANITAVQPPLVAGALARDPKGITAQHSTAQQSVQHPILTQHTLLPRHRSSRDIYIRDMNTLLPTHTVWCVW